MISGNTVLLLVLVFVLALGLLGIVGSREPGDRKK